MANGGCQATIYMKTTCKKKCETELVVRYEYARQWWYPVRINSNSTHSWSNCPTAYRKFRCLLSHKGNVQQQETNMKSCSLCVNNSKVRKRNQKDTYLYLWTMKRHRHTSSIGSIFWNSGSKTDNAFEYSWRWKRTVACNNSYRQTNWKSTLNIKN